MRISDVLMLEVDRSSGQLCYRSTRRITPFRLCYNGSETLLGYLSWGYTITICKDVMGPGRYGPGHTNVYSSRIATYFFHIDIE